MANDKHGVYVTEQATGANTPIVGTAGLQVIVGTAPVNMLANPAGAVNVPILANTYAEAVKAVGFSTDFANYTLCQSISASFQVLGCAPMVLINVLDPAKHNKAITAATVQVNSGVAIVDETGILPDQLVVKKDTTALKAGEDYTTTFNDDGTLSIVLIAGGAGAGAITLAVTGKKLDPSAVTEADIVGKIDTATGAETGLEVVRQIYPKLSLTAGLLLAPGWSQKATVGAALQAKCENLNGSFRAFSVIDVDSGASGARKYTDVKAKKEGQGITSVNACAVWPCAKVGETIYAGSTMMAAQMEYIDAANDDVPNVSPDNKTLPISTACLADGTEVLLDQEQANTVNSFGVATFLNMNGYRTWGNNTAAYPGNTDPKDRFIAVRRFLSWTANTFILTYFGKVGAPANRRMIDSIVDSENVRGNSFVARGICARYELKYLEDENTESSLLEGRVIFHQYCTPFVPANSIENTIEFDASALASALNG